MKFKKDDLGLFEKALKYWGEAQIYMLFEEMAELQKAICKNHRGVDNRDNIIEEIADTLIMLKQMERFFRITEKEVSDAIQYKLDRLEKKILLKECESGESGEIKCYKRKNRKQNKRNLKWE